MAHEYHAGKLGALIKIVASLVKNDPSLADNYDYLRAILAREIPALANRKVCANCDASMQEYTYTFDQLDATLLLRMGEEVRKNLHHGFDFTEANKVKVQSLSTTHSIKCRTTIASKLGLIAQCTNPHTKKRVPGMWLITTRGWEALRGEKVPLKVKVWRGNIEERFDTLTTLAQALSKRPLVDKDVYNPEDWYATTLHEGRLL